jgi:hypothetical protein
LNEHNVKRTIHKVNALSLDIDIAKRAQTYSKALSDDSAYTIPSSEKCSVNTWKADDSDAAGGKEVTENWYKTGTNYDWDKKVYEATAKEFTNMIWRSATRVGFGRTGNHVVAVYCETPGNVLGRFQCNVCPAKVGCDAQRCPEAAAVCSSDDGHGNAEFSLTDDE